MSSSANDAPSPLSFAVEVQSRAKGTSIEEAIATIAPHYLTQPGGAHAVKEGLLGLRKVGDLSEDQLIRVIKGLRRRDWLREWFPSQIPRFEQMAQTALVVKRAAHSQQAMVEHLIDLAEELPTEVIRDAYWRAVVYLLHRKSLAGAEARFLLLRAGFMQQADSYAPIVHEEVVTGEADAGIDDWWRL
jgi:hypothetical protein